MTRVGWLALLPLLAIWSPRTVHAQIVRGTVTDESGTAARAALVTAGGHEGDIVARTVSDSAGRYHLQLPRAGAYSLRALRVGYVPSTPVAITVAERDTVVVALQASSARIQLATYRVQGARSCRVRGLRSAQEQSLWEQAIASLTSVGQSLREPLTATTLLIDRVLDARGRRVQQQRITERSGLVTQPWRSMPIDSLRQRGFVWTDESDSLTFIAPSIDVLLSPMFLEDHCLTPRFGSNRTEIGIAFEPVAARSALPGIHGVIWLAVQSAELRRLEFSFTSVPNMPDLNVGQTAGGSLRFARVADGSVHIVDWEIRIPTLAVRPDSTRAVRVAAVQLSGGRTIVLHRGTDTLYRHVSGMLTGRVRDAGGRPLVNAVAELLGVARSTTSGDDGRFVMSDLLPGTYRLRVASAPMRALARDTLLEITLLDSASVLDVRLPTNTVLAREFCAAQGVVLTPTVTTLLAGVVLPDTLAPARERQATQRVLIRWQDRTLRGPDGSATTRTAEVQTDAAGAFQLCGLPATASVTLRAVGPGRGSPTVRLDLSPDSVLSLVTIPTRPTVPKLLTISGVVSDSAQRPIVDAEVSIADGQLVAQTDARGVFVVRDAPDTDLDIRVRKLGFEPWALALPRQIDDSIALAVSLRRVTVLESVRSVAPVSSPSLQQFEANRRMGLGRFLTPEELRRADGTAMSTILGQVPGLRLLAGGGGRLWIASSRAVQGGPPLSRSDRLSGAPRACYVKVYQDGVLLYGASENEPLFDLSTVRVEELDAIEFYAGGAQVPSQYGGVGAACGVLALWSRQPIDR